VIIVVNVPCPSYAVKFTEYSVFYCT